MLVGTWESREQERAERSEKLQVWTIVEDRWRIYGVQLAFCFTSVKYHVTMAHWDKTGPDSQTAMSR